MNNEKEMELRKAEAEAEIKPKAKIEERKKQCVWLGVTLETGVTIATCEAHNLMFPYVDTNEDKLTRQYKRRITRVLNKHKDRKVEVFNCDECKDHMDKK